MMIAKLSILLLCSMVVLGCSSTPKKESVTISPASSGVVNNYNLTFPLYLTDKIENREEVVSKTAANVFIVHTGHLLRANLTKEQNEETLKLLENKGIDLVNLSIEDFIIAKKQEINFENYKQTFLNSSVVDLNEDNIITKNNIVSYAIHEGVALIGLSDHNVESSLSLDEFLVSDYVLAILRARKNALKEQKVPPRAFVIVHTIGASIDEVMDRLPPSFINSLAN